MEINERIKAIIKELYEGSTNKFAEAISVKPSVVSGYTGKRQSKPSYDVIERIVANANISPDWLITGEGSMLRQHPKEELEKTAVSVSDTHSLYYSKQQEPRLESQDIPLYSYEATGGILENIDNSAQYIQGTISIPNAPRCDGAVRVVGDSMAPAIQAGDIIAFKILHEVEHILFGDIFIIAYAIDFDEYLVCKIIRKSELGEAYVALHSLNPSYDPVDIPRSAIRRLALVKLSIHFHSIV